MNGQVLRDVAGRIRRVLAEDGDVKRRDERHDLDPARKRRPKVGAGQGARNVGVAGNGRGRGRARQADARLRDDDTERGSHCQAAVLDLNLLVAAVRVRPTGKEAERVEEANRRSDANVVSNATHRLAHDSLLDRRLLHRCLSHHLLHRRLLHHLLHRRLGGRHGGNALEREEANNQHFGLHLLAPERRECESVGLAVSGMASS